DVGGFLDDLRHRERALEMGIVDGGCPYAQASGRNLDDGIRPDPPPFQSESHGKGLERRTGFERIGQRPVPKLRPGKLVAIVGVVRREIREREQLARVEVVPVLRSFDRLDILDRLAESVLDHPAAAGLAGEPVLKRELDTLLAYVVNAREAEYVRSDFATWVVAPVLAVLEQPGDVQSRN